MSVLLCHMDQGEIRNFSETEKLTKFAGECPKSCITKYVGLVTTYFVSMTYFVLHDLFRINF